MKICLLFDFANFLIFTFVQLLYRYIFVVHFVWLKFIAKASIVRDDDQSHQLFLVHLLAHFYTRKEKQTI